jgi:hypothetical protein
MRQQKRERPTYQVNGSVAPASAEPVAPASAEPVAPASAEPVAPASAEPVAPASAEPVAPASAEFSLDPRYSHYLQYYLHLVRERSESQNELDKSLINISSASIAASIAVIKPLYDTVGLSYLGLIFASWIAFCCAIVCTIESYQKSVSEYDEPIADCQYLMFPELKTPLEAESEDDSNKHSNNKNAKKLDTSFLNLVARLSFYAGVIMFLVFIGINIVRQNPSAHKVGGNYNQPVQPSNVNILTPPAAGKNTTRSPLAAHTVPLSGTIKKGKP